MATAKVIGIKDATGKYDVTAAIVRSNKTSGIIPDVIDHSKSGTAHLSDCKVGLNLLKTRSAVNGTSTFDTFVRGRTNPNQGGYYYAYAYENAGYVEASCSIPLSKCSVANVSGKRRAYVSMGVLCKGTTFRFFDVGLANDGNGWYPYVYGKNVYDDKNNQFVLNPNVEYYHTGNMVVKTNNHETGTMLPANGTVTLKLEAGVYTERDYVRFTYTCGSMTGTIAFNAVKGTMHQRSNNKPVVQFYRFMSLIPLTGNGENDVADRSALSAVIDALKLGSATWDATKIQHSYASQIENIKTLMVSTLTTSVSAANQDYCHIYHDTATHPML